jgi:hypothetical protein
MPAQIQYAYAPAATQYYSTTANGTASWEAPTWQAWNNIYATTGATTTVTNLDTTWQAWNNTYIVTTYGGGPVTYISSAQPAPETDEQRAERERRDREWARQHEERRLEREAANVRAQELLLSLLSEEQAATYREKGWFEVRGSKGGRWRIRNRGQSGNVDLMPEIGEEREATYCAHPPEQLPDADAHVAQMLHLVTDEEGFVRTAIRHYRRAA